MGTLTITHGPFRESALIGWISMPYVFIFLRNSTFSRKKNLVNLRKYVLEHKSQFDIFCLNPKTYTKHENLRKSITKCDIMINN